MLVLHLEHVPSVLRQTHTVFTFWQDNSSWWGKLVMLISRWYYTLNYNFLAFILTSWREKRWTSFIRQVALRIWTLEMHVLTHIWDKITLKCSHFFQSLTAQRSIFDLYIDSHITKQQHMFCFIIHFTPTTINSWIFWRHKVLFHYYSWNFLTQKVNMKERKELE